MLTSTIILTVGKVVAIFCGWGGRIVTGTQPEVKNKTFYKHGVYFTGVVILVLEKVCGFMVFNTIFNNITVISCQPVLLLEETGIPGENHRPVVSHWQTFSHNVVSRTARLSGIQTETSLPEHNLNLKLNIFEFDRDGLFVTWM